MPANVLHRVLSFFTPSESVLAENCVCLRKKLCRCYSDRLKYSFFTVKHFAEQKFQVHGNGETGHFSDPAALGPG